MVYNVPGQTVVAVQEEELGPCGLSLVGGVLGMLPAMLFVYLGLGGPLPALWGEPVGTAGTILLLLGILSIEALYGSRILAVASGKVLERGRTTLSVFIFLSSVLVAIEGLIGVLVVTGEITFCDMY